MANRGEKLDVKSIADSVLKMIGKRTLEEHAREHAAMAKGFKPAKKGKKK
jgi:hypothetical protein